MAAPLAGNWGPKWPPCSLSPTVYGCSLRLLGPPPTPSWPPSRSPCHSRPNVTDPNHCRKSATYPPFLGKHISEWTPAGRRFNRLHCHQRCWLYLTDPHWIRLAADHRRSVGVCQVLGHFSANHGRCCRRRRHCHIHRHRGYRSQQPADFITTLIARNHSSLQPSLASLFLARFRLAPATVRNVVIVVALAVEDSIVIDLCCPPPGRRCRFFLWHSGTSCCRLH